MCLLVTPEIVWFSFYFLLSLPGGDFLYSSVQFENLKQQEHIIDKNTNFKKNSLELDKKLKEYINNKDKKNASSIFKLDIYDRNIEDNLFLIYYFLSYGILGLFIYKLLK